MGFRNPATSATAVDTGLGVIPGVKVYSDKSNPGAGVVEWDAYTARATSRLTSSQTGSGGTKWVDQLVNGPSIEKNIEADPGGGYVNVLRLKAAGGRIVPDAALDPVVPMTGLPLNATFFSKYDASAGETGSYRNPYFWRPADGLVVVTGLVLVNSTAFGLGVTVGTLPAGCRPAKIERFTCQGWGTGAWIAEVAPNGVINYSGASSGSPSVGSFLSLAGITFPAEQ